MDPCTDGNQHSLSGNDAPIVTNVNNRASTNEVNDASNHDDISTNHPTVKESTCEEDKGRIDSESSVVNEDLVSDALETREEKDEKSALIDVRELLRCMTIYVFLGNRIS